MSGKIKSTIELAMEKAAKLPRLTEEELRQQREKEYGPRGRAIAGRFLAGDLEAEELEGELSGYGGEAGGIVRRAFLTSMCQAMDLEHAAATARASEGIEALVRDDQIRGAIRRAGEILGDYGEQRERDFARAERAEAVVLRELGIAGSAIRPNMEQSAKWRGIRERLLEAFRPKLDEIRRDLSDRLNQGISSG